MFGTAAAERTATNGVAASLTAIVGDSTAVIVADAEETVMHTGGWVAAEDSDSVAQYWVSGTAVPRCPKYWTVSAHRTVVAEAPISHE